MAGNDTEREPLLEMFLFESNQMIEQLEEIIIRCESAARLSKEDIDDIFRCMHSIKGSAAMMMFSNVTAVAHALEDVFFFIRANSGAPVDFSRLSDLVLSGIDFIKGELVKIGSGKEPDRPPDKLVVQVKEFLGHMKDACHSSGVPPAIVDRPPPEKIMYYISNDSQAAERDDCRYYARIWFSEDCQMENVRAFTVINNLKDIAGRIEYAPADLIHDDDSAAWIRAVGFLVTFTTAAEALIVRETLQQTAFLRKLELFTAAQCPPDIQECLPVGSGDHAAAAVESSPANLTPAVNPAAGLPAEPGAAVTDGKVSGGVKPQQSIISVGIRKLDTLMDLVGEIVISEAMVSSKMEALLSLLEEVAMAEDVVAAFPGLENARPEYFSRSVRQLRKLTNELQDIVMSIRMVPVSMTFQKMVRIVRDMSKKLNKDAELEILGETTEVDKNIIDHLSDPLMHLIRNAMDHGLESREDRLAAGKPAKARITLEARNAGGEVWILVRDDGRGLNREKILQKAREKGLLNKAESELSDSEVYAIILLPGFSTQEKVTEFSGRGVGMDVVKKNIESVGGAISLSSVPGKGTEVLIKIPLTLAIIDGIEIGVAKSRFTIPTTAIRESFRVSGDKVIADADGNEIIMIRGQCYPVLRIGRMFNVYDAQTDFSEGILVMVEGNGRAVCLFADRLIGEQQVVVKALPRYIKHVPGIAGCTILGDGSISLILDVNTILTGQTA